MPSSLRRADRSALSGGRVLPRSEEYGSWDLTTTSLDAEEYGSVLEAEEDYGFVLGVGTPGRGTMASFLEPCAPGRGGSDSFQGSSTPG